MSMQIVPARRGIATRLSAGQFIRIVNTHGTQVVDTWAFCDPDLGEFMSMEHTRTTRGRLLPAIGESFVSNLRRPVLTVIDDTSGGVHDTMMAACDRYRYELLGCADYHDNCTDNLHAAMKELGLTPPQVPCPLNVFMNIPVLADGSLGFEPPVSTPGSALTLRAERDLVMAFSACPQDMVPINGVDCIVRDAAFEILS